MSGMSPSNASIFFGTQYGMLKTSELTTYKSFNDNDILVYNIHLPDYVHIVNDLSTFLKADEKKRALNYYKERDKNRFIICRSLLKFALSNYAQVSIKDISIELLLNKKPYLPTHPSVSFNVSHSGDYAVLALGTTPIGIDIEYLDLNYTFQETLGYIFNENEIRFLNSTDNKVKTFYNLWTRKESFVKALGIGIDEEFLNIPCLDGLHNLNPKFNIPTITHWQAMDFQVGSNYQGSLVFATNDNEHRKIKPFHFTSDLSKLLKIFKPLII